MAAVFPPSEPQAATSFSGGEKIAWLVFLATSVHLAFLRPYLTVIPGENAKVFSGLWCALSLALALIWARSKPLPWKSPSGLISLALLGLALISSLLSPARATSLARGFVIMAAGLGGYWGARLLLGTAARQHAFLWFCLGLQIAILLLVGGGIWASGSIFHFLDEHYHPVGSRIILLSCAPLALLYRPSRPQVLLGLALLSVSYLALLAAGKNLGMGSAVLIPPALVLLAACFRAWSARQLALLLLGLALASAIAGNLLWGIVQEKNRSHESVAYRMENVRFSWHLVREHPWFGIGLLAPREPYLQNYQVHYPYLTGEKFSAWTQKLRTSENNFLTFMADLGLPFTLLYSGAVIIVLVRLFNAAFLALPGTGFPPLALLLPLLGEILHFQVLDGLFHPHISWYFHILLGLGAAIAPAGATPPGVRRAFLGRLLAFSTVMAGGAALGVLFGQRPPGQPLWNLFW